MRTPPERETPSWSGKGMHLTAALLTRRERRGVWGIRACWPGGIPATARVGVLTTPGLRAEANTVTHIKEGAPPGATCLATNTPNQNA